MINDPVLLNDWHVVAYLPDVPEGKPVAARLLDEDIVLWRTNGRTHAWRDLCVHRGTKLSLGKIENETLICPYHGWTYNAEGRGVRFPAHPTRMPPAAACATVYHVQEKYNWSGCVQANPPTMCRTFRNGAGQVFASCIVDLIASRPYHRLAA